MASSSGTSDGGIPPPNMTFEDPAHIPDKNLKEGESEDDREMCLQDFLRFFEIGNSESEILWKS